MQTGRPHAACTTERQHSAAAPGIAVLRLMQSDLEQVGENKYYVKPSWARTRREQSARLRTAASVASAAPSLPLRRRSTCASSGSLRSTSTPARAQPVCAAGGARAAGRRTDAGKRARGARRPNSLKQHQTVLWQPWPCLILDLIRRCWSSRPLRRRRPGPAKEAARAIPLPDGQARARGPGRGGRSRGGAHST